MGPSFGSLSLLPALLLPSGLLHAVIPSLLLASPFLSPAGGRATHSPHHAGCFGGRLSPLCSSQLVLSAPRGWFSYGTMQRGGAEASGPRTIPRSSIKDNGYNGKSMENM